VGYWLIFLILGLIAVVSIAVASLPLRSAWLRVPVLVAHIVVSVLLIAAPGGTRALQIMVFGPGLLVALIRLIMTAYRGLRSLLAPTGGR
jgi:hypothetical protein